MGWTEILRYAQDDNGYAQDDNGYAQDDNGMVRNI
jgi:hypothetical protein